MPAKRRAKGARERGMCAFVGEFTGLPEAGIGGDCSLSLEGEGWGEGEHAALVVVPFTSGSLLL
ncbi:hypothetical protein C6560_02740 [Enterobacter sp. FS01]|nr:hypothetical protein C6560_02740 [Enterobacter sp. FS01]